MSEEKRSKDEKEQKNVRLEWKDYLAVIIAAFQTTLLPFLVVIVVLVILWLVLKL